MENVQLDNLRHSCAHLLAKAVLELWPGSHNAIGPSIENGFYQDFDMEEVKISEDDLSKIEKKMREILPTWKKFTFNEVSLDEAVKLFRKNPYKVILAKEFAAEGKKLSTNDPGNFLDLCKMGHCEHPDKELKHFKLLSVAGAYWKGSEKNKMLTRIYGTCFPTKEALEAYLKQIEEAKKRDHRKLGKELDLFTFSELVGAGLPLFTPKGTILREELNNFSQKLRLDRGYQRVWVPHIAKNDLYKKSGHWDKFGDELFLVQSQETDDVLVMKPMNCPHHQQIYASHPRSYRDLPIKYLETTTIYRDEKAGELNGLSRVRSVTQDDSHSFCTPDQLEEVVNEQVEIIDNFYKAIGMKLKARLSYRDPSNPKKYLGDVQLWEKAQNIILKIAKRNKLDYFEVVGEAAFYGPKIDYMATDAIGREWQVATSQLDFVQPARFELVYTDSDGQAKTPVMIHFALMGSIERFLSVLIEHTAGAFPLWIAPVQVAVLPISDKQLSYATEIEGALKKNGLRVIVDREPERIGKKIRIATLQKVPYMIIIGDKEVESYKVDKVHKVSVRTRDGKDLGSQTLDIFINTLKTTIENHS